MITDETIEMLLLKGEGSDLDYKAEQYPFADATDEQKSELLKDILAFANAHREGPAYILIGFKEDNPHPPRVIGIPKDSTIDDSRLQEFINSKLETKLNFKYHERLYEGKHVAVISIPHQKRPFYLKKHYGNLKKDIVYVRRGSATAIASLREITLMGEANVGRQVADISLSFETKNNAPLPNVMEKIFLSFEDDLPDLDTRRSFHEIHSIVRGDNLDYWREAAEWLICTGRLIEIGFYLENLSGFSLSNAALEVTCQGLKGTEIKFIDEANFPSKPHRSNLYLNTITKNIRLRSQLSIDSRGEQHIAQFTIGTVRPKQRSESRSLGLLPSAPGHYCVNVRILADEIPTPLEFHHEMNISGDEKIWGLENLKFFLANN